MVIDAELVKSETKFIQRGTTYLFRCLYGRNYLILINQTESSLAEYHIQISTFISSTVSMGFKLYSEIHLN